MELEFGRLNSVGTDLGGLDEVTTWSREFEGLVSLLAVMAMICQFRCTEVRQWLRWTSHEERCGRNSGSLVDSKVAFEVGVSREKDQTKGMAGNRYKYIEVYRMWQRHAGSWG